MKEITIKVPSAKCIPNILINYVKIINISTVNTNKYMRIKKKNCSNRGDCDGLNSVNCSAMDINIITSGEKIQKL